MSNAVFDITSANNNMGGSRRRLKKNAPKVRNGLLKRKRDEKTKLPLEIAFNDPALEKRLRKRWVF